MVRVIFLNRFFAPDDSATSQLLSDLAFSIAAPGRDIRVIASRPLSDKLAAQVPDREVIDGVTVHRVWMTRMSQQRLAGKLLDYLSFYVSATWKLLTLVRAGDLIIVKTDPPMIGYAAAVVAKMRRASLVNWLQDLFPEVAEQLKVPWIGGVFARVLRALRNHGLVSARLNVVIGERMRARLIELGCEASRIRVIQNWSDGNAVVPIAPDRNPLRKEWGLEGKFVVGYSGNFGRVHEFATLLDAGERLRERGDICFLMIGRGVQYETLRLEAARRGLTNWVFRPFLPRERLTHSLGAADVHLISLQPQLEGLVVPSKFYGVIAAGRPAIFVGAADGEIAQVIRANDCGGVVEQGDGVGLAREITKLAAHRDEAGSMGSRARQLFEREFDRAIALERWSEAIKALTQPQRGAWRLAPRAGTASRDVTVPALTVSVVAYENPPAQMRHLIETLRQSGLEMQIYLVDNSRTPGAYDGVLDGTINYMFSGKNLGFGRAHNVAFQEASRQGAPLHLITNPDIMVKPGALGRMVRMMQEHPEIALLSPRVLYPNGTLQRLCKRLPNPYDMLVRRFGPAALKARNNRGYELHGFGYDKVAEIPSLTGAFMLVRADAFARIGGFDERYFLYMEDIDLCRRLRAEGKTVFYPEAEIVHHHGAGSYDSWALLFAHLRSSVIYFNEYGWLFDRERRTINQETLEKLQRAESEAGVLPVPAETSPALTRTTSSSQTRM